VKALLEPLAGIIRVFDNNDAEYGDPYSYAIPFRTTSPTDIELIGTNTPPTLEQIRAILQCLRGWGFKTVNVTRYKEGKRVVIEHRFRKDDD
jgi:hypothetical protein